MYTRTRLVAIVLLALTSPLVAQTPASTVDAVHIEIVPYRGDGAWFAGQLSGHLRAVQIVGVTTPLACEQREVEWTFLSNAPVDDAAPTMTSKGEWFPLDSTISGSQISDFQTLLNNPQLKVAGSCFAVTQWRLGESPGHQFLRARLVRDTSVTVIPPADAARTTVLHRAIAHAPPALIAGLVLPFEPGTDEDGNEQSVDPIIGFDSPILFRALPQRAQVVLAHFRPMVATSITNPGQDVYAGFEISPLWGGARALASPLQFSVGHKWGENDSDSWWIGAHYSTTDLLGNLFDAL
jgi:hypothetical protein